MNHKFLRADSLCYRLSSEVMTWQIEPCLAQTTSIRKIGRSLTIALTQRMQVSWSPNACLHLFLSRLANHTLLTTLTPNHQRHPTRGSLRLWRHARLMRATIPV